MTYFKSLRATNPFFLDGELRNKKSVKSIHCKGSSDTQKADKNKLWAVGSDTLSLTYCESPLCGSRVQQLRVTAEIILLDRDLLLLKTEASSFVEVTSGGLLMGHSRNWLLEAVK